jgi:hypothetical protein
MSAHRHQNLRTKIDLDELDARVAYYETKNIFAPSIVKDLSAELRETRLDVAELRATLLSVEHCICALPSDPAALSRGLEVRKRIENMRAKR